MKVLAVFACILAAAAASAVLPYPSLIRTPQFDSAVITSERLGGNFAYKSVEGHAFASVNPIITNVPTPVGVSYSARPIVAPVTYTSPAEVHVAPITYTAPLAHGYGYGYGHGYGRYY